MNRTAIFQRRWNSSAINKNTKTGGFFKDVLQACFPSLSAFSSGQCTRERRNRGSWPGCRYQIKGSKRETDAREDYIRVASDTRPGGGKNRCSRFQRGWKWGKKVINEVPFPRISLWCFQLSDASLISSNGRCSFDFLPRKIAAFRSTSSLLYPPPQRATIFLHFLKVRSLKSIGGKNVVCWNLDSQGNFRIGKLDPISRCRWHETLERSAKKFFYGA